MPVARGRGPHQPSLRLIDRPLRTASVVRLEAIWLLRSPGPGFML